MAATTYTVRATGPTLLERGRSNTITCPVVRDGVIVAPTSGTVTVWNASGTEVVTDGSVTITGNVATRALSAELLAAQEFSDAWRFEWTLDMPDSVTHTFRLAGSLVYRLLYPVVSDGDLQQRHHNLPRRLLDQGLPSMQDYLDAAWAEIQSRLVESGKRPFLVADPTSFRRVHLYLALSLAFTDLSTQPGSNDEGNATTYQGKYETAWTELSFPQAKPDGTAEGGRRRAARPVIWFGSGR